MSLLARLYESTAVHGPAASLKKKRLMNSMLKVRLLSRGKTVFMVFNRPQCTVTAWKITLTAISLLTGAEIKGIIRPKEKSKTIKVKRNKV
jgi:hypothetical protein